MLPLPSRTHPKKQNLVVYTKELTHLLGPAPHFGFECVLPVSTSIPAIPQCAHTPGSLPREIDTSDTHFSDLTCPRECL